MADESELAVLKINNDLERIGDLSVNIAERAVFLASSETVDVPLDFPRMAEKAQFMLRTSLESLANTDLAAAIRHRSWKALALTKIGAACAKSDFKAGTGEKKILREIIRELD